MSEVVAVDSSPIIFLSRLDLLDLLPQLYERVLVARSVYEEVVDRGANLPGSAELAAAGWPEIVRHDREDSLVKSLRGDLGPGEVAMISVALSEEAGIVLIDDRPARLAAERLGLQVQGSLGLLVTAKRQGLLQEVLPLLERLREGGAWLSRSLVEEVARSAGEDVAG